MTQQVPAPPPELGSVDALAAEIIARAAPIRFGTAASPEELTAIYRLRCRVVVEEGWADPQDFPDGLERDAFDTRAVQIAAWENGVLVGTSRLVLPLPPHPLPTEEAFGLTIRAPGQIADVGRLCVAPERRDIRHTIWFGLVSQAWIEMRARGFAEASTALSARMAGVYRRFGLEVIVLAAPRLYWGQERFPALVRPKAASRMPLAVSPVA